MHNCMHICTLNCSSSSQKFKSLTRNCPGTCLTARNCIKLSRLTWSSRNWWRKLFSWLLVRSTDYLYQRYDNIHALFPCTFLWPSSCFGTKCLCLNSDVSMYIGIHLCSSLSLAYFCASLITGEDGRAGNSCPCASMLKI